MSSLVDNLFDGNPRDFRKTKAFSDPKKEKASQQRSEGADEASPWNISFSEAKGSLNNTSTKIYAQVGGDALLPCRVGHLGDRQV